MVAFENLIRKGKSLMLRMEKQIKHGVDALPNEDRVIIGEDDGWFRAAENLLASVFGPHSTESKTYMKSMESEYKCVEHWITKGSRCSHGDWNIWLIGHAVGLLTSYEHYPEPQMAQKRNVISNNQRNIPISIGSLYMGDNYQTGQAGAVGPHSTASHISFQQLWINQLADTDLSTLANELNTLRNAMRSESTLPEHDIAIGEVAAAQTAARAGDGAKTLEHLKKAGRWSLDTASKIGVAVAVKVIEATLGL